MHDTRPEDLTFTERAPWRTVAEREVVGTPHEVFAVLADTEGWPRWFPGLRKARWTSDAPHGVGSTREVAVAGGTKVAERFIAWDVGEQWAFTFVSVAPDFAAAGVEQVLLEDAGNGRTRVRYTMALEPRGRVGAVMRYAKVPIRLVLERALRNLERQVQAAR